MREFSLYNPEDFGFRGSPSSDEAYVIIRDINTDKAYLTYIVTEDIDEPPIIDLDSMEEIQTDFEDKTPVFNHISMRKDGTIMMDTRDVIVLNEVQNELLAYPSTLYTTEGRFVTQSNNEATAEFRKDLTLEGMAPVKLDYRKAVDTINEKYPALLKATHENYGNRFPYFPFAKYFDDVDKMVVFMTKSQAMSLDKEMLNGNIPFYKNFYLDESWDVNNTYGVCIIDEKDYNLRLISPKGIEKWKENEVIKESNKESEVER